MKTCDNCKHSANFPCGNPCSGCIVVGGRLSWEPKNFGAACKEFFEEHIGPATGEEPDCEKCKHTDKGPEEEPCQECGIDGDNYFEPKEEKKMDNRKTKAQLMEELEQKNDEIAELKKELERSANYEQYLDAAKEMRSMVDAFVESGFTEEQSITIVAGLIGQATRQRLLIR